MFIKYLDHIILVVIILSLHACLSNSYSMKGDEYAKAGDWDRALEAYQNALFQNPNDHEYKAKVLRAKEYSAIGHYEKGKEYLKQGKKEEALIEFKNTIEIDPSYQKARQEIEEIRKSHKDFIHSLPKDNSHHINTLIVEGSKSIVIAPDQPALPKENNREKESIRIDPLSGRKDFAYGTIMDHEDKEKKTRIQESSQSLLTITPSDKILNLGDELLYNVEVRNIKVLYGAPFFIIYDPMILEVKEVKEGDFLKRDGKSTSFMKSVDNKEGKTIIGLTRIGSIGGISGSGVLATIRVQAKGIGSSEISIQNASLKSPDLSNITIDIQGVTMTVK